MNPGWSPAHERAATLPFDGQAASARLEARQTAKERRPSDNTTAASPLLRFLYWIYERRLLNQLKQRPMPRHVGIILDGNRRHARKRGLSDPYEIYQRGAEKLDHILDWCANLRIPAVTLWVFSTENLKRSQAEVIGILSAIEAKVAALAHDPFVQRRHIRVRGYRQTRHPARIPCLARHASGFSCPFHAMMIAAKPCVCERLPWNTRVTRLRLSKSGPEDGLLMLGVWTARRSRE